MSREKFTNTRYNPNDEAYTYYESIEKELRNYPTEVFKDKIVYCNCDCYKWSNFVNYFVANFRRLGLKELRATNIERKNEPAYYYRYDGNASKIELLTEGGSWDSSECLTILNESDIIVTNPPFSQLKFLVPYLVNSGKGWLIVAHCTTMMSKGIVDSLHGHHWHAGFTHIGKFYEGDTVKQGAGNICWFGNLVPHGKIHYPEYEPTPIQYCDNYPEVRYFDRCVNVPMDLTELAAVPTTWGSYNIPDYEIITVISPTVNGVNKFKRLLIKRK